MSSLGMMRLLSLSAVLGGAVPESAMRGAADGAAQPKHGAPCHAAEVRDLECPPPGFNSVASFSVADYISAPWYAQMQSVTSYQPEDTLYCVRANYTEARPFWPGSKKELLVDNYARNGSVTGARSGSANRLRASIKDLEDPSKLVVGPPFLPVFARGDYWVVALSKPPYTWAIVAGGPPTRQGVEGCIGERPSLFNPNGNGEGLWLFTREPVAPAKTVASMVQVARGLGLDTSVLVPVAQEGCCGAEYGVPCA